MSSLSARLVAATAPVTAYQRFLYRVGAILIVSGLFHLAVYAVDGGGWWGSVSWRKPISFGISFGLASLSVGWVLGHLAPRRRLGWTIAGVFGVSSTIEVAAVTLQRWRGVPSHFNLVEPFDAIVFGIMGVSVLLLTLALVTTFVWAIADRSPAPEVRLAILAGLALLLVASALGNDLISRGNAEVSQTGVIPGSVFIGAAGSGKLAHAVGLHGIQVFGVLGILLGLGTTTSRERVRAMRIAALAYVGLFGVVVSQTYGGRAVTDLNVVSGLIGAVCLGGLGYSGVLAIRAAMTIHRAPKPVGA